MKNTLLICIFFLFSKVVAAQMKSDTEAYRLEKNKINNMLHNRQLKFGQYDESLSKHTGIFGLQTKKDIRRSNDILMDIVKTDNEIYRELKILLDFKTFQQNVVQSHTVEVTENNLGFMHTINKLRNEVDRLKAVNADEEKQEQSAHVKYILVIILMFGSILYLLYRGRARNA